MRRGLPIGAIRDLPTLVEAAMQATSSDDFLPDYHAADLSFAFDLQNVFDAVEEVEAAPEEVAQRKTRCDLAAAPHCRSCRTRPRHSRSRVPCRNDDEPVLIIEDDAPVPAPHKPPVRREEYRNLFSRLRSG